MQGYNSRVYQFDLCYNDLAYITIIELATDQSVSLVSRNKLFVEITAFPTLLGQQFLSVIIYIKYWCGLRLTILKRKGSNHRKQTHIHLINLKFINIRRLFELEIAQ